MCFRFLESISNQGGGIMAEEIKVRAVESKQDLNTFIMMAYKIYQGDANWVPPILMNLRNMLSFKHNPYFEHADGKYFIAFRGSEPAGRITAQIDRNYDEHWGGKTGHFGFFESVPDQGVANALFDAAGEWLRKNGRDRMQGPYNLNINDECGLLIDGFDSPPMVLMTYNPDFYPRLYEAAGFSKAMDLYAYRLDSTADAPQDVVNYAEKIRHKEGIVIRSMRWLNFEKELDNFVDVYNHAWEENWGMVALTEKEIRAHALELRFLAFAFPELNFFAEQDGKIMGMSITIPNLNEALIKTNGKTLPFVWRLLRKGKRYESCRVFALGVKKEFRRSGVASVFYVDTLMAAKRLGIKWGEMSWILETNDNMNRAIKHMGGTVYKTYRIYERPL
jgi:GNAT superfamily N-acetyltransferase